MDSLSPIQPARTYAASDKVYNFNTVSSCGGGETFDVALAKASPPPTTLDRNETKASVAPYVDPSTYETASEDSDFGFDDFIDVINPLQHIPIIGTIYRGLTGDEIKPASRIAGDVMYGALVGGPLLAAAASIASLAIEQQTGEEPTTLVADAVLGIQNWIAPEDAGETGQNPTTKRVMLADNTPVPLTPQETSDATPSITNVTPSGKTAYGGVIAPTAQMPLISPQVAKTAATKFETEAKMTAAIARAAPILPTETSRQEGRSLAQMMREGGDVKAQGGSLPPNLVHDMMLMALDKYKVAGNIAPSELRTGRLN